MMDLNDLFEEFESSTEGGNEKLFEKYIKDSKSLVAEAVQQIHDYQTKVNQPVKFSMDFMNSALLGGLFAGNVIGIAGSSGHGKSVFLQRLETDIFDKELNPDCDDYILLRNNYEMSVFKLYLRALKTGINKKISDILGEEFTVDEKARVDEIKKRESDPRIKYFETPQSPEDWFSIMCSFCEHYKDKKHIIITIDHIALTKQTKNGKKDGIDNLIEYINTLRHIYKNVSFIILSQLNRNIEERDNPRNSAPKKGDLYQSDFLFQLSDVIVVVHNPYKLGLQEHMVVAKDMYTHLNQYKKDPSKKTSTFVTRGLIFYHFIKLREDDDGEIPDLYIEKLNRNTISKYQDFEVPRIEPNPDLFTNDEEDSPFD